MKPISIFLVFFFISNLSAGQQSLGIDRVQKLKKSVVRVLIDGMASGTGFFLNQKAQVATCWHVIESSLPVDNAGKFKKIEIEFVDGKKYQYRIINFYLNKGLRDAVGFDYCVLEPSFEKIDPNKFTFFKIGNFSEINEGDAIFCCGYPLNIKQQFISTGILASKWKQVQYFKSDQDSVLRDAAWLDLTMNLGNSGGPIIKFGNKTEEDVIIGIATFIITPYYAELLNLEAAASIFRQYGTIDQTVTFGTGEKITIDNTASIELLSKALKGNAVGISACISVDYLKETIATD